MCRLDLTLKVLFRPASARGASAEPPASPALPRCKAFGSNLPDDRLEVFQAFAVALQLVFVTMGCSQSATAVEEIGKDAHGHTFGKLPSTKKTQRPLKKGCDDDIADQVADSRCIFHVEGATLVECEESPGTRSYDSWQHVLDAEDVKMLRARMPLPVNQAAHNRLVQRMESSLLDLAKNPAMLTREVARRRVLQTGKARGKPVEEPSGQLPKQTQKTQKQQPRAHG